jgi:hypothetical protein
MAALWLVLGHNPLIAHQVTITICMLARVRILASALRLPMVTCGLASAPTKLIAKTLNMETYWPAWATTPPIAVKSLMEIYTRALVQTPPTARNRAMQIYLLAHPLLILLKPLNCIRNQIHKYHRTLTPVQKQLRA